MNVMTAVLTCLTRAAIAVRGLRMTTSWLSTLRVMRLVGVTTSRLGTVLPPACTLCNGYHVVSGVVTGANDALWLGGRGLRAEHNHLSVSEHMEAAVPQPSPCEIAVWISSQPLRVIRDTRTQQQA